jgi:hypothetical protein
LCVLRDYISSQGLAAVINEHRYWPKVVDFVQIGSRIRNGCIGRGQECPRHTFTSSHAFLP